MKIIGLTDIHGDIKSVKTILAHEPSVDLILLIGDITNFGREREMAAIIDEVRQFNDHILTVPGNCDFPESEKELDRSGTSISNRFRIVNGNVFIGLGASLHTPRRATPYEVSDEYLQQCLQEAATHLPEAMPTILVSHQPPIDTVADRLTDGQHVGSRAVRRFIEQHKPLVCFTGHIHEGIGLDAIGTTRIVNSGPVFMGRYTYAEITDTVETLEIRQVSPAS